MSGVQQLYRQLAILLATVVFAGHGTAADDAADRREAMAVENVQLAEGSCGYELTGVARTLIARDTARNVRPFADNRAVLANLWNQTFACNPDFAGENCFAARWQMCQQAYAEFGPEGVRVKGLIKAIVKK